MKSEDTGDKPLYKRTIDYISGLRDDPSVKQSEYHQILMMFCERILHEDVDKIEVDLENAEQSKQKCSSCGGNLGTRNL